MAAEKNKRNQSYGITNPIQSIFPEPINANRDPNFRDNKKILGTLWINNQTNNVWILTSVATNAANWEPVSQSAGGNAPISLYIIDTDGTADYTTIQEGIDAANVATGGTVYIRPGLYTEDLILYDNVYLIGATSSALDGAITIAGTHTLPAAGNLGVRNIRFTDATTIFGGVGAGTTDIYANGCLFTVVNGSTFEIADWTGNVFINDCGCDGADDGFFNNATGTSTLNVTNSVLGTGATNLRVVAGPAMTDTTIGNTIQGSGGVGVFVRCQMQVIELTVDADYRFNYCNISDSVSVTATSTISARFTYFLATGAAAITNTSTTHIYLYNCIINTNNNPAIAGTGTINIENIVFLDNIVMAGTLTLNYNTIYSGDINAGSISFDAGGNQLDVYEQGAFTPTISFAGGSTGVTYGTRNGYYVKIGKLVFITVHIVLTSKGTDAGAAGIGGLPFTSQATRATAGAVGYWSNINLTANYFSIGLRIPAATNTVDFRESGDNNAVGSLSNLAFANNTEINAQFLYEGN